MPSSRVDRALVSFANSIIPAADRQAVDLFKAALLDHSEKTHLPEIYEAIGPEAFLKLITVFQNSPIAQCLKCGEAVTLPSLQTFIKTLQEIAIYTTISASRRGAKVEAVTKLARRYNIDENNIYNIFLRVEKRVKRYKIDRPR